MNTTKLFNQVLDKFPAVSSLKLWKVKDGFKLIAWENKHIFIINFLEKQFTELITKSEKLPASACYEEVLSEEDVVDIFRFDDRFITVDCQSWISEIIRETVEDTQWEGDLFEDNPKKIVKSELKKLYRVCNDSLVLAVSLVHRGISLLVNTNDSVLLKIVDMDTLTELHSIIIRNSSLNLMPNHNKCLMLFVAEEDIERSYVESWMPEIKLESFPSGLIIIALPDSYICALLLDEIPIFPHFLFSWPFQTVAIHWFCLNDKETDRIQRRSNLVLVFDGGSAVTLGQYGGKVSYLPMNSIRNGYASKDFILVSDHTDCYSLSTLQNQQITCLPVKGVLGFCPVPDLDHIVLVSTRHKTLYAINMDVKMKRENFKMPNLEIFDEFLKKTKYFGHLSEQIAQTDDYINTLSYAVNSNLMKFTFFMDLVMVAGFVHSFRIKVSNQNPGIVFRKKIWKFAISLYSNDNCYTFVRDLETDLKNEDYFVDFISVECNGNNWDFCADAMFVSYLGNTKYRPIVSVAKEFIDISHFIQPVSCLKLHQSQTLNDLSVENILENITATKDGSSNKNTRRFDRKNDQICTFEIPINEELNNESVVNSLLKNCKELWRETEINDCLVQDKFRILIGGNLCNIEIRKSVIKISGRNSDCCHSLKVAAVRLLNSDFNMNISADMQPELDDVMKSLELLQYNTSDSYETKLKKTMSLYQEFNDNLVYRMTGIKMDISPLNN